MAVVLGFPAGPGDELVPVIGLSAGIPRGSGFRDGGEGVRSLRFFFRVLSFPRFVVA